jgi:hypothetical protein
MEPEELQGSGAPVGTRIEPQSSIFWGDSRVTLVGERVGQEQAQDFVGLLSEVSMG